MLLKQRSVHKLQIVKHDHFDLHIKTIIQLQKKYLSYSISHKAVQSQSRDFLSQETAAYDKCFSQNHTKQHINIRRLSFTNILDTYSPFQWTFFQVNLG